MITQTADAVGTTILNVDDYEATRYSRSRVLKQAGFTVLEARTGAEALEVVRAALPALVILDVNLPDISGFEVCRQIKGDPRTASVLVLHLSASSVATQHKLAGLEGGSDSYLTEPLDPEELIANVRALLRLRHAESSLRAANRTLEALITASPLAIVAVNRDGIVQSWNMAAERLFGYTAAEVVGQPYPVVPESRRVEADEATLAVDRGEAIRSLETERLHKLGHLIEVNVSAAPIRGTHGEIVGRVAVIEDITDRRRVEREMAGLFAEVQKANRAKDDFLAVLSHELRTPLNAMLGWVRMLRRTDMTPEKRTHAVEVIERNTIAQMRLIEDILDVSRIVSGKLRLEMQPLNLIDVVDTCADAIKPIAESRGLTIHVNLPDEAVVVSGDAARLQQVILNLLSNAVKFTPPGGRLELTASATTTEARVTVQDSGIGIDPDFLPHVFDRFRQASSGPTRSQTGLGLGLAIVHHIVEAHGGSVQAVSAGSDRGSTFEIRLPRIASTPVSTPRGDVSRQARLDGMSILIVDRDGDSRGLVAAAVRHAGAETMEAGSVEEALVRCAETPPDIILADLTLPDADGHVLMERLRTGPADQLSRIPVLAITGYSDVPDRVQTETSGLRAQLEKPDAQESLVNAVARTLDSSRQR
jgi:PAS domain S-box-containing protein